MREFWTDQIMHATDASESLQLVNYSRPLRGPSFSSVEFPSLVGAHVESQQYGCWEGGLCRIACGFPQAFKNFIQRWREDPSVDPFLVAWMEMELHIVYRLAHCEPLEPFWASLREKFNTRHFRTYAKWQEKDGTSLSDILTRSEMDDLGGTREDLWIDPTLQRPRDLTDYATEDDLKIVRRTLTGIELLPIDTLALRLDSVMS